MDVRKIAAELRKIENRAGRLTAEEIVKLAANPKHPLHAQFEWDDTAAGHRYRVWQARKLIVSVQLTVEVSERVVKSVAYVRDPAADHGRQGYRSVIKLSAEEDDAREAVIAEFARAATHLRRARDLAFTLGHADEIEELIGRVVEIDQRIMAASAHA